MFYRLLIGRERDILGIGIGLYWYRSSSIERSLPLKVVFHQRLSTIDDHLPSNVVFHRRSSSIERHLPAMVVFNQTSSSVEGSLPLKVPPLSTFFHICSHLLTFVHIGSHLIPFDHTCSQLFTFVYICLQLFTFVHIFSKGTRIMWSVPTLYTNMFIWLITYLRGPFVHISSHLFTSAHICSHLLTFVHICSKRGKDNIVSHIILT